jgi:hypothetical protein
MRKYHKEAKFGPGPRLPIDREGRAVWKARVEIHCRAGRITDAGARIAYALLKRLGADGRCDPSHQTLADDTGRGVRTVRRALLRLKELGLISWFQRLVRDSATGWRVEQASNAYCLLLSAGPAAIPVVFTGGQPGRATLKLDSISLTPASAPRVFKRTPAVMTREQLRASGFR